MFKSKEIIIAIGCLTLGYIVASSTKQNSNENLEKTQKDTILYNLNTDTSEAQTNLMNKEFSRVMDEQKGYILPVSTVSKIKDVIEGIPDSEIEQYLMVAFPNTDISKIDNKKRFSERMLEELSSDAQTKTLQLDGQLTLATNPQLPLQNTKVSEVYRNQQLFAHYDLRGKFEKNEQVFVKWTNQDTGEILLFTPQNVNKMTEQNWISYSPPNGWQPGTYNIEYYEFNSDLNPIAKTSYTINQILD